MISLSRYIEPRRLLASLALPLFFAFAVLTVVTLWSIFDLPSDSELVTIAGRLFDTYGYLAVFLSAIIEGALVIGLYYPGALIIFLSVILAGDDIARVATVVLVVTGGFMIGLSIDYALGKYGWYRLLLKLGLRHELEKAQARFQRRGVLAIVLTYWDVNLASFTATAAGILRYPFATFVFCSLPVLLFWGTLWATVIYFIGKSALEFTGGNFGYPFAVLIGWMIFILVKHVVGNVRRAAIPQVP